MANRLASGSPRQQGGWFLPNLDFVAAVGNTEARSLLRKRWESVRAELSDIQKEGGFSRDPTRPQQIREHFARALDEMDARLSLPEIRQRQRCANALLFWQTIAGSLSPARPPPNFEPAVAGLARREETISVDYLIEQLDAARRYTELGASRRCWVALLVIGSQKENSAIPAILKLAERVPEWGDKVRKVLKQIGTPEAESALRVLDSPGTRPAPAGADGGRKEGASPSR